MQQDTSGVATPATPGFRGYFVIDRPNCLKCAHLAPDIADKAFSCTAENGNANCPAQSMTVIVGTNADKAGTAIAKAVQDGDFEKASKFFGKLGSYHEVIQQQVMGVFRSKMLTYTLSDALPKTAAPEDDELPDGLPEGTAAATLPDDDADLPETPAVPQADPAPAAAPIDSADWDE